MDEVKKMSMNDYILTKKSYIQNAANELRGKEGSSNKVRIHDLATRIRNLPTGGGGAKLQTKLDAAITINAGISRLEGKLKTEFTEADSEGNVVYVDGVVGGAILNVEGKKESSSPYEPIDPIITERDGTFTAGVGDYNVYRLSFDGTENISSVAKKIVEDYIVFIINSEDENFMTSLQFGEGLKVYQNGTLIDNNEGQINTTVVPGEDTKFIYYGFMSRLEGEYEEVKHIETHANIQEMENISHEESLESIVFSDPCSFEELPGGFANNCSNLKMARLPNSVKTIANNCFERCTNLEYVNVPAINWLQGNFLSRTNVRTLELESGLNIQMDYTTFPFDSNTNLEHLIVPGESVFGLPPSLEFGTNWLHMLNENNLNRRLSFTSDTKRILNLNTELTGFYHINFPISCEKIDDDTFKNFRVWTSNPIVLRFESIVPPQMGDDDEPANVFNESWNYIVICPAESFDLYEAVFMESGSYAVLRPDDYDYPSGNDNGEFSIDIVGKHVESNPDVWNSVFYDTAEENYYYLDDVLQKNEGGELLIYEGGRIDYSFEHYGRHALTVAGGFTQILENAFKGNTQIVKFRFPYALESIGAGAFMGCANLKTLIFRTGPPEITSGAFDGLNPNCNVFVPEKYYDFYYDIPDLNQYNIVPYATELREE